MERERFWHIRSANYDKLFWVKDQSYIDCIVKSGGFKPTDYVLDVGTGTGVMARALRSHVQHVVGLDISDSMLQKGVWEGISILKWDISEHMFAGHVFDKVMARMCFHHILEGLDDAISHCHTALKRGGSLIVAEGVPPSDDGEVVNWYTEMFKLKEERLVFTKEGLSAAIASQGFSDVKSIVHVTKGFSVRNWLVNSGLDQNTQDEIMSMHFKAGDRVKAAYNMKMIRHGEAGRNMDDCLIDTVNVVCIGYKG